MCIRDSDYTIHIDVATGLVRKKLDEVEAELKRMLKRDEAFVRALRNDVDVNHRQRSVLQMALSNPEAVFRIESHQKTHKVAYATARADLYGLVDLGFLKCVRTKRAFEFPVTCLLYTSARWGCSAGSRGCPSPRSPASA